MVKTAAGSLNDVREGLCGQDGDQIKSSLRMHSDSVSDHVILQSDIKPFAGL